MATFSYSFSAAHSTETLCRSAAADLNVDQLIQECAAGGNEIIWKEFTRRFGSFIAAVVSRAAMRWTRVSPELVEDLVQETYLKLCTEEYRHLRNFTCHHVRAIYGFLRTVACNATTDRKSVV